MYTNLAEAEIIIIITKIIIIVVAVVIIILDHFFSWVHSSVGKRYLRQLG